MITLFCDNKDYTCTLLGVVRNGRPRLDIQIKHSHPAYGSSYLTFRLDQNQLKRLRDMITPE